MKMTDAVVVWTPGYAKRPECPPGSVRVEHRDSGWDRTPGDSWMPATGLGDMGFPANGRPNQLLAMFVLFNTITVRDMVPVEKAHAAFLQIDEYRETISPDSPGAD